MSFIPLYIEVAKIILASVILFFLIEFLPMPENAKRGSQGLLLFIVLLTCIELFISPGGGSARVAVPFR